MFELILFMAVGAVAFYFYRAVKPVDKNEVHSTYRNLHDLQNLVTTRNWCVVDTETTGLENTDQVIEIGIVDSSGEILFESRVRPTVKLNRKAIAKHGIKKADLKSAPQWPEIAAEIERVCAGKQVFAYNAEYDERLIKQTSKAFRINPPITDIKCIMLAYTDYRGMATEDPQYNKWWKLVDACETLGIPLRVEHAAINDALMAQELAATIGTARWIYSKKSIRSVSPRKRNRGSNRHCSRCNGRGYIPNFRHIDGGKCFSCGGTGRMS